MHRWLRINAAYLSKPGVAESPIGNSRRRTFPDPGEEPVDHGDNSPKSDKTSA
jgi:hypothetical protein